MTDWLVRSEQVVVECYRIEADTADEAMTIYEEGDVQPYSSKVVEDSTSVVAEDNPSP